MFTIKSETPNKIPIDVPVNQVSALILLMKIAKNKVTKSEPIAEEIKPATGILFSPSLKPLSLPQALPNNKGEYQAPPMAL